ncbi:RNA polymerase sigma factor [Tenacibaculum sp. TC6]|uniref:RNA polymerase sigma factor n=1 Tax=Tenacibaculum sp. TC6 TaxID=3423223 RepID=UPI003D367F4E
MTIINDQTYINKTLAGDTNAFAFLVNRYKNMVFTLALKMVKNREEAEEISQDTFIKAFKNLEKFKGEAKFSTWLYKITYRTCLDSLKKIAEKYTIDAIDEVTIYKIKETESVLDLIEQKERAKIIDKCMYELPEDERSILWFFYYEELSLKEIVAITELTEANVKVKLHRARKRLLTIIEKRVEPELINHYGRK